MASGLIVTLLALCCSREVVDWFSDWVQGILKWGWNCVAWAVLFSELSRPQLFFGDRGPNSERARRLFCSSRPQVNLESRPCPNLGHLMSCTGILDCCLHIV
jgi:hypothetical protein